MLKIFFITFFIAESIIALALILKIHKCDKLVNSLNKSVLESQGKIISGFELVRAVIKEFSTALNKAIETFRQKKQEYLFKIAKTSLIYVSIFMLKGKYKKSVLAYQVAREIYEGIKEA